MRFLIEENLSPTLVHLARERGPRRAGIARRAGERRISLAAASIAVTSARKRRLRAEEISFSEPAAAGRRLAVSRRFAAHLHGDEEVTGEQDRAQTAKDKEVAVR